MTHVRTTLLALVAVLATAGCVTQPSDGGPAFSTESPTAGGDSQDRTRARVHTQLAASYYEVGNMRVALDEVKEALAADANFGPAYNIAALVYAHLKDDRLAEQNFQRALAINPNDPDAHNNFGSFLCDRRRESEAVGHFLAAVRNPLYPSPERSYVNAGLCSRRAGDVAAAAEYFQTALKMRPTEPQALHQLADIAYARGEYVAAKGFLARLAREGVSTPEVLWLGTRVERRLGDRNSEASYASQLRNRFPNSAEARALSAGRYE